ncbi:hypothetical protein A3Q56_07667 [Intoshia linei]|uniref:rRNA adenine N(6)-methyltransferase n=1 Tax=Intoshia linei TaxID=1819745 RepID=A0A177ARI5_9BILA|nr:hypothetical protein A3Q56_07667 [Intoshia linei]
MLIALLSIFINNQENKMDFCFKKTILRFVNFSNYEKMSLRFENMTLVNKKRLYVTENIYNIHAILMFQREFAQRLVAKPGDKVYCRLSVNAQLLSRVSLLIKVGKNNFKPPPKVESNVVRIEPIKPAPIINYKQFDILLRICFNRKNKLISSGFKSGNVMEMIEQNWNIHLKYLPQEEQKKLKNKSGKDMLDLVLSDGFENSRSRTTSIDSFLRLLSNLNEKGIHFA